MNQTHVNNYPKNINTAIVLLVLLGIFGAHRFYLRSVGIGILYLCTLGLLGLGPLIDLFTIVRKTHEVNEQITQPQPI